MSKQPNLIEKLRTWYWQKFVIDAGEFEELDYDRIKSWKHVWCWIVGHVEYDVEVGEHWASSVHIETDYALVCCRCGRWL